MAQKQSLFGRIAQLAASDPATLVAESSNPSAMREQLTRYLHTSIGEAERAVTQTVGNLRLGEADHAEDVAAAKEWGILATSVALKADALRHAGRIDTAAEMDGLARIAIRKQSRFESFARHSAPLIASQSKVVENLKAGILRMQAHLSDLESLQTTAVDAVPETQRPFGTQLTIDVLDPTNEVARFEEKVHEINTSDPQQNPETVAREFENIESVTDLSAHDHHLGETEQPRESPHPLSEENEENN